jgi:hypothetical protein
VTTVFAYSLTLSIPLHSKNMAKPKVDFHVCIVGAGVNLPTCLVKAIAEYPLGMGGLACALSLAKHGFSKIDIYETASNLGFVGAGIQLAPNMARILDRFGVWDEIAAEAVDLKETSIRRRNFGSFDMTGLLTKGI